jgi:hypothetical protein
VSRPEGTASAQGLQLSLYSQTQETCDDYDHDHHTDDVKDIHCVLLRVRDANPLAGWQICDWVHPGSFCHGCQSVVGATMRSSTNVSLYQIAHAIFCGLSFVCLIQWTPSSVSTNRLSAEHLNPLFDCSFQLSGATFQRGRTLVLGAQLGGLS